MKEVDDAFKRGLGASAVLEKLGFSQTILLSVMIAERNGQLVDVLASLSVQLEKVENAKKKVKSILAYPILLFVFIGGLLIGFRHFFLPNMQALSYTRQASPSLVNMLLPKLVSMLPDFIIVTILVGIGLVMGTFFFYQKNRLKKKLNLFIDYQSYEIGFFNGNLSAFQESLEVY